MNGTGTLAYRTATELDVLAWLNADYRLRAGLDLEVDSGAVLRPETTIAEWRSTCDLVSTRTLAKEMHDWFDVARPVRELRAVLEPEREQTLGDLARYVAPYMRVPEFRPIRVAGVDDPAAGVFFCLRNLIAREGVPVHQIRPSTPIGALDTAFVLPLGKSLARLSPELTPEPRIVSWRRVPVGALVSLVGVVLLFSGYLRASLSEISLVFVLVVYGVCLFSARPAAVEFGSYANFGDLARAIADRRQAAT